MTPTDAANTKSPCGIAAAMRRQASTDGLSRRQLPGGLLVRLARSGETMTLTLMRRHPGPTQAEREGIGARNEANISI